MKPTPSLTNYLRGPFPGSPRPKGSQFRTDYGCATVQAALCLCLCFFSWRRCGSTDTLNTGDSETVSIFELISLHFLSLLCRALRHPISHHPNASSASALVVPSPLPNLDNYPSSSCLLQHRIDPLYVLTPPTLRISLVPRHPDSPTPLNYRPHDPGCDEWCWSSSKEQTIDRNGDTGT